MKRTSILLLVLSLLAFSPYTVFASTEGEVTCPKTVKAGQYFEYLLECPDEEPVQLVDSLVETVYLCYGCKKYYHRHELVDGLFNGIYMKVCPECKNNPSLWTTGWTTTDGYSTYLAKWIAAYGSNGGSWGCTAEIVYNPKDSIQIHYEDYNNSDYIKFKEPGTYYLISAFGFMEDANLMVQVIDPDTHQLVDDHKLDYQSVTNIHYKYNTITVLGRLKFNANKGKVKKGIKWIKQKSRVGTLPKATRNGYTFKGWYTKRNGGKKISNKTKVIFASTTKTYYAHWKKK